MKVPVLYNLRIAVSGIKETNCRDADSKRNEEQLEEIHQQFVKSLKE